MAPGLVDGAPRGVATAFGVAIGCLRSGSAAVLGLSAFVLAWPLAFTALKWAALPI
jgi:threonine/homoserine/homoserine lactone efflux protein